MKYKFFSFGRGPADDSPRGKKKRPAEPSSVRSRASDVLAPQSHARVFAHFADDDLSPEALVQQGTCRLPRKPSLDVLACLRRTLQHRR